MQLLTEFWNSATAPQATIVSGGLTLLAAVLGVVIGWWLFSGRVKDLKSALEESDSLLADHRSSVEKTLLEINEMVKGLNEQFATTLESLGQLRGNVSDLQSATLSTDETPNAGQPATPEKLRDDWAAIRDQLEQRAADPAVDGRRRAKYARIDRRRYLDLIDALANDGALGVDTSSYREASAIWQRYRNGRRTPTADDAKKMSGLRQALVGGH